jgi:hypothetical protein
MYTVAGRMREADLDDRVPPSIAQSSAQVNICLPAARGRQDAGSTRFGFKGSVATREACDAVGITFHPQISGWMVHVYPFDTDTAAMWRH